MTGRGDRLDDRPAQNGSVAERVTARLQNRIADGRLPVGSRLPSERDLAVELAVSRTTVRHAVQALAHRGLLDLRGRSGAYVRAPTTAGVSTALQHLLAWNPGMFSAHDLVEVRRLLEIEVAGLAARRRTRDDLREIARWLADSAIIPAEMQTADLETWCVADVEFHTAIARATHNPLVVIVYEALRDVFLEQRRHFVALPPALFERGFRAHHQIFERISLGDADGARRAMQLDLEYVRENLLRLVAEHDGAPPSGAARAEPAAGGGPR
jgi:DNA-binding FadR family transcriptional regulator